VHWRLRLRLRPRRLLARGWARAVRSVCADFPYPAVRARAFPACPTACRPSRLSSLCGAARPVSLAQTMMVPVARTAVRTALPNSRPSRVFALDGGTVGRCPPHARACQVWGLGCRHRHRGHKPSEIARIFMVRPERRFFSRFRADLALVVLRNNVRYNVNYKNVI
jgi:hypothetical protein